jgi:hypothetical protein
MLWRRGRARAEPEQGDDRWGPPVSRARRGAKEVRGEAFPRGGGGNRVGRHRRATGWAGQEAEAQWGEGEWLVEEKSGRGWAERPDGPAGRWADWAESEEKILL